MFAKASKKPSGWPAAKRDDSSENFDTSLLARVIIFVDLLSSVNFNDWDHPETIQRPP